MEKTIISPALKIRPATEADLAAVVALMSANAAGARVGAETADLAPYRRAFRRMTDGARATLYVARFDDDPARLAGSFEFSLLYGLSFQGRPRAQVESVHVNPDVRRMGIGAAMMRFAEARARAEGCALVQLTSNKARQGSHDFYRALGYEATHEGYKRML